MSLVVRCAKVDPSSGCNHVVRAETEEELMRKVAEHAKEHGIREPNPQMMEMVKRNIERE